jgi:hypothetical protein
MRIAVLALMALALAGGSASAQPKPEPSAGAHPKYTLETPILVLMEDPRTLAVLDKHLPGLSERMRDPEVATIFSNTSLDDMSKDPDHGRALTTERMARLAAALEAAQAEPQP